MPELSPCRQRVLATLGDSEWTGTELAFALGRLRTNIARDLRIVRDLGLVESRRDGVCVFWRAVQRNGHQARVWVLTSRDEWTVMAVAATADLAKAEADRDADTALTWKPGRHGRLINEEWEYEIRPYEVLS